MILLGNGFQLGCLLINRQKKSHCAIGPVSPTAESPEDFYADAHTDVQSFRTTVSIVRALGFRNVGTGKPAHSTPTVQQA